MFEFLTYVASGALVGFIIGLTGVGGGSLMTPLLIFFGHPAHLAIGTDLLYAAMTKSSGVLAHNKRKTIDWRIAATLACGSLPASIITSIVIASFFHKAEEYTHILQSMLGVMLILTSIVIFARRNVECPATNDPFVQRARSYQTDLLTVGIGIVLGVLVTLSSVGAGAVGTAVLFILYPMLPASKIVGTDLAHAVPLTFVAGASHLVVLNNVDIYLLFTLLIGSLPAIWVGTLVSVKIPGKLLQPILASALLLIGLGFFFIA